MPKCEQINDLGITVDSAFTPSANVLKSMLYFIKRSLACLPKETFVHLYSALVRPHLEYSIKATLKKDIDHLERIQKASTSTIQPKFSRPSGLRKSPLKLFHHAWRTQRRSNSFACRVFKYLQSHRYHGSVHSKKIPDFTFYSICAQIWSFWETYPPGH